MDKAPGVRVSISSFWKVVFSTKDGYADGEMLRPTGLESILEENSNNTPDEHVTRVQYCQRYGSLLEPVRAGFREDEKIGRRHS